MYRKWSKTRNQTNTSVKNIYSPYFGQSDSWTIIIQFAHKAVGFRLDCVTQLSINCSSRSVVIDWFLGMCCPQLSFICFSYHNHVVCSMLCYVCYVYRLKLSADTMVDENQKEMWNPITWPWRTWQWILLSHRLAGRRQYFFCWLASC